ncbi:hypothetical protein [Streptomyces sp. NRRL B-1347]|uniref:hypothetical protein n=1 Tax=Streptomyces sp. NRRL B-1347 TaxID=1476877 RepID=UPI00131E1770|nr:hypothetical protein [Streptomyces sp. NRRL B-1347]
MAVLAAAVTVPLGAPTAQAALAAERSTQSVTAPGAAPSAQAIDYVAIAKAAYAAYQLFAAGGLSLEEATQRILDAIGSAKTEILAHIDQVAAAEARSCARHAVIDVADIRLFTPDTLQSFARDTTGCVTLADSLLGAVSDKGAADQLGFAVNAVGPIALLARARAGFDTAGLKSTLRSANNAVLTKLEPVCTREVVSEPGPVRPIVEEIITCTAYNGASASDSRQISPRPQPAIDVDALKAAAAANTSWPVAKAVLPTL